MLCVPRRDPFAPALTFTLEFVWIESPILNFVDGGITVTLTVADPLALPPAPEHESV